MSNVLQTPVLFIVYNRLDTVRKTFSQIRKVKPQKLYIACDGFQRDKENDKEKVEAVRRWVIDAVDWECQVKTRFSEENQGCKYGPANAISWIFEDEEEAIILEDDIAADESFFWYCQEMLQKYRYDTRIMVVSGQKGVWDFPVEGDYFFTSTILTWGWATWRRAWEFFDIEIKKWPYFKSMGLLKNVYGKDAAISLSDNLDAVYSGKLDAWDYAWLLACVSNMGLAIQPGRNLIENIGYGEDATHTVGGAADFHVSALQFPLRHSENVIRNWDYDRVYAKKCLNPRKIRRFIRKFIPRPILRRWYRFRGVKGA